MNKNLIILNVEREIPSVRIDKNLSNRNNMRFEFIYDIIKWMMNEAFGQQYKANQRMNKSEHVCDKALIKFCLKIWFRNSIYFFISEMFYSIRQGE